MIRVLIIILIVIQPLTKAIDPPTNLGRRRLRSTFFVATWEVRPNTNYKIVIQESVRPTFATTRSPSTPDVTTPFLVRRTTGSAGTRLQPNRNYDFIVFAINPSDSTDFNSAIGSITTAPPAPTDVRIHDIRSTTFIVSWSHDTSDQLHRTTGYEVTYTTTRGTSKTISTNGLQRSLTINDLTPSTGYNVSVRGTTAASINDVFTNNSTRVNSFTVPGKSADVTLSRPTGPSADPSTMIKVDWNKPPGGNAIDNYIVEYKLPTASYNSSPAVDHVVGTTSYSYIINNLIPGGSYDVRVRARNSAGDGQPSLNVKYITIPTSPEYRVTASTNQLNLAWNTPNGFFDGFVVKMVGYQRKLLGKATKSYSFQRLNSSTTYTIRLYSVRGNTTGFPNQWVASTFPISPVITNLSLSADPSTMIVVDWNKPDGGDAIDNYTVQWTLSNESSYNLSATVAHVAGTTSYSYIINNLIPGGSYDVRVRARNSAGGGQPSIKMIHTKPSSPQYHVTASTNQLTLSWDEPDGLFDGFVVEIVGYQEIDVNATVRSYTVQGLNSSTDYTIRLYSVVTTTKPSVDQRSIGISTPLRTLSSSLPGGDAGSTGGLSIGLIVGITCGIIALFLILVILGVCLYRRRKKQKIAPDTPNTVELEVVATNDETHIGVGLEVPVAASKTVVSKEEFNAYMKKMSAGISSELFQQYEMLTSVGTEQPATVSLMPKNLHENRYKKSIFCYDATRVILTDDVSGSSYINANHINGYNGDQEFIAAQGPLPSSKIRFWKMIWDQNSKNIVMLTQLTEKGKTKCDRYWPGDDKAVNVGDMILQRAAESVSQDWTQRQFQLTYNNEMRTIYQFHYTAWPDHGVPDTAESLVRFIRYFRGTFVGLKEQIGPITVHCSAGVGRTGTFIAMDHLLQRMKEHSDVDIYGIVYDMRKSRGAMVQNYNQYLLLHTMVKDVINGVYDDITEDNPIYENTTLPSTVYENVKL